MSLVGSMCVRIFFFYHLLWFPLMCKFCKNCLLTQLFFKYMNCNLCKFKLFDLFFSLTLDHFFHPQWQSQLLIIYIILKSRNIIYNVTHFVVIKKIVVRKIRFLLCFLFCLFVQISCIHYFQVVNGTFKTMLENRENWPSLLNQKFKINMEEKNGDFKLVCYILKISLCKMWCG